MPCNCDGYPELKFMNYEPITDAVYWYCKDKSPFYKAQKSKASGSGIKGGRSITKKPRQQYRKYVPYVNPYQGKSAYDALMADPNNYIPPK